MKKSELYKTIFINAFFIGIALLSLELMARILTQARVDTSKPIRSLRSFPSALLNRGGDWNTHLNQSNIQRKPYPYLMFKGAPNAADHNYLGYRISDPITLKTINIALFGGSTGYQGSPPIINLLTQKLNALKTDNQYAPLNFSVVSSNHNQHLHSIIENYNEYPIDIIIFYGGYNETFQTALYDPRPGYPYNYQVRNEMSPEEMFLRKHFVIYTIVEKLFNKFPLKPFSGNWNTKIVENYIETIDTARLISKSLATGRCKTPFLFIYQPYQITDKVPELFKDQVHSNIKLYAISSKDGIDVSDSLNEYQSEYEDGVHLSQSGRKIVAQKIFESSTFIEAVKSCKN